MNKLPLPSITSTAPLFRLKQIWNNSVTAIRADFTGPIAANLVWAFRAYIAFHIFTRSLDLFMTSAGEWLVLLIQGATFGAALLTLHRRYYPLGLIVLLLFQMMMVFLDFPNTANHYFVELYLLILLSLCPNRQVPGTGQIRDGTCYYLIQLLFLSIYFYAGIHKAIYGFWLDGEFIADTMYNLKGYGLPTTLQTVVPIAAGLFNLPMGDILAVPTVEMGPVAVQTPLWFIGVAIVLGWVTVISEIIIPPLVLLRRTRKFGVWLMFILTTAIGLMSWEIEFLFVAWGCILLFFPDKPLRNYTILFLIHLGWSVYIFVAGIPIWVL